MRKFIQLAEDVEADLKELDNAADDLADRRRKGKERATAAINNHHRIQDRIDEGVSALEKVADAAGFVRANSRTAAEIAAIEAEEKAQLEKLKGDKQTVNSTEVGEAGPLIDPPIDGEKEGDPLADGQQAKEPKLGEASGDTPPAATFHTAAE